VKPAGFFLHEGLGLGWYFKSSSSQVNFHPLVPCAA
jgi:hypothetical protein